MNQVTLVGRITRNLNLKTSTTGKSYVYFSLAINEGREYTNYVNCVAWNKTAENMAKYVGQGSLVSLIGYISTRKNNEQYITEVVANNVNFLNSSKRKDASDNTYTQDNNNVSSNEPKKNINLNDAFQNDDEYNSEVSFINNNSVKEKNNNQESDDDAVIWD